MRGQILIRLTISQIILFLEIYEFKQLLLVHMCLTCISLDTTRYLTRELRPLIKERFYFPSVYRCMAKNHITEAICEEHPTFLVPIGHWQY